MLYNKKTPICFIAILNQMYYELYLFFKKYYS